MIDRIGVYEILRELGRGGMGEVYLARDTRLDRQVAIKALPAHLATDPDRLARFQREAKVLASLNHPGISAIYGLEEVGGHQYLILEFVEGQTLADRLTRGAIPIDEALSLAKQIAEALEVAHEKGIVHRDLKPGNVMITPEGATKVLDFGLARTIDGTPSTSNVNTDSPTITTPPLNSPTIAGVIMGTAGYMSPEQARGKGVDKRSDIFSYGCILYEMLSGAQPFRGETVADSLGAILHREPDWGLMPSAVPLRVRELLKSCLAKDRKHRLHDIGDARLVLERHSNAEPETEIAGTHRTGREILAWTIGLLGVLFASASWLLGPSPNRIMPQQSLLQFTIPAPPGTELSPEYVNLSIAPNGRSVVFCAKEPSRPMRLWVRDFDAASSRCLEGTEGASMPFWSPDSQSIAFFAGGALCRISARGGPAQRITDAPGPRGGDWSETGVIVYAPSPNGPLYVVPQSGGLAKPVAELDAGIGETGQRFPQFLPGGKKFLYAAVTLSRRESGWIEKTRMGSLDSSKTSPICEANTRATYAPGGWLVLDRAGTSCLQKFDPATGVISGEEIPTILRPTGQWNFTGNFSVTCSNSGVACYVVNGATKSDCIEIGADGQILRTVSTTPEIMDYLHASPSGEFLGCIVTPIRNTTELRLFDLARAVPSRPVDNATVNEHCWSPDSQWVYYTSDRTSRDFFRIALSGGRKPELVYVTGNLWASPKDVSTDGRLILYNLLDPKTQRDLWIVDTTTKSAREYAAEQCNEFAAKFSPDQSLVALATDESGSPELYVQAFPKPGPRVRVSLSGIAVPDSGTPSDAIFRWSRDGSCIYFLDSDRRTIRSAPIITAPALHVGKAETLIRLPAGLSAVEIAASGKSAFATVPAAGQAACAIAVTMNWMDNLKPGSESKK